MKLALPFVFAILMLAAIPPARAKDDKWVEARSQNFIVVSNAGEKQARDVAIQFEQIRELFQRSMPFTKDHPTPVITILAAKDENTLKELLPEYWAEKGHSHPAGIFISFPYQQSIAVQLSGLGDNPYEAIYHEYYHSLTIPYFPGMPVWFSEGMADFYGNSKISDKTALLGMPNFGLVELLHQQSLIPLSTLFQVKQDSPYYNESNKVSIFYGESWALTHYLMVGENGAHRPELQAYLLALGQGESQQDAATKAFGDLGKLQRTLQSYVNSASFYEFRAAAPDKIPESAVEVHPISDAEADAYRGGFLALHKQYKPAEDLLQEAIRLDPKLALAQQNLAISYYFQEKSAEAISALSAAIELDPKVTVTRYLRADLTSRTSGSGQSNPQVEADLRAAIAANSNFAPAYGLLANHLATRGEQLPEALDFAKKSVALEPGNSYYQLAVARVLARMQEYDQAQAVATTARANARDANSKANADQFLEFLRNAREIEARNKEFLSHRESERTTVDTSTDSAEPDEEDPQPADGKSRVDGTVTDIQCKAQEMTITIAAKDGPTKLHSIDNTKMDFTSDVPLKSEEFWPCTALKGRVVRVVYLPNAATRAKPYQGEMESLEIRQ
jgi:tetratricopeptide (TPR) repeat protein